MKEYCSWGRGPFYILKLMHEQNCVCVCVFVYFSTLMNSPLCRSVSCMNWPTEGKSPVTSVVWGGTSRGNWYMGVNVGWGWVTWGESPRWDGESKSFVKYADPCWYSISMSLSTWLHTFYRSLVPNMSLHSDVEESFPIFISPMKLDTFTNNN